MKKQLQLAGVAILCLFAITSQSQNPQVTAKNYADILVKSFGVTNPENAVDADLTNYAVMRTNIGVLNSSTLKLGWSQVGSNEETAALEFQNDNGALSLDVLQTMTLALYDSNDKQVGKQEGFDFSDASVVQGTSRYKIRISPKHSALNIASIRIKIAGLASLENRIRIYNAALANGCPGIRGGSIFAQHNVSNANNAISDDQKDFATLNPPLLSGDAYLDLAFTSPPSAGKLVTFQLGEGTVVLNADLLQKITCTVYDTDGNVVASQSGFDLADADVLGGGRFNLDVSTPDGSYQVGRGRVRIAGLLNVLTTLKVYDIVGHIPCNTNIAQGIATSNLTVQSLANLQVYPNPFHAYAVLDFKNISNNNYHITITDKAGKVVEQRTFSGAGSVKILEEAEVGVYFIKISSGSMVETRKVIKL